MSLLTFLLFYFEIECFVGCIVTLELSDVIWNCSRCFKLVLFQSKVSNTLPLL